MIKMCPREDSNLHALAGTSTSSWPGYQLQHLGKTIYNILLKLPTSPHDHIDLAMGEFNFYFYFFGFFAIGLHRKRLFGKNLHFFKRKDTRVLIVIPPKTLLCQWPQKRFQLAVLGMDHLLILTFGMFFPIIRL